jgi:hypothetical protein
VANPGHTGKWPQDRGSQRKEVVVMVRLRLDTSEMSFQVTRAAEARMDFGKDVQKVDRDTGRPQWVVELLAQDPERGEVIRITVAGDQPKVTPGQPVRIDGLEAIPWSNNGKSGVAFRAAAVHPVQQARAA